MAKVETGSAHHDLVIEKHPRLAHERAVVLALADPGHIDEGGALRKSTHREIAERLYEKELSRLQGRSRAIRLAAAAQSVRDIGKRFISKLNNLGRLEKADHTRTTALFEEIGGLYTQRKLKPNDLYEIFRIPQENGNPYGSRYQSSTTAPSLPQPEADPVTRPPVVIGTFVDHLLDVAKTPKAPALIGTHNAQSKAFNLDPAVKRIT